MQTNLEKVARKLHNTRLQHQSQEIWLKVLSLEEDPFLMKKFTEPSLDYVIQDFLSSLDSLSTGGMQSWSLWHTQQASSMKVLSVRMHVQG